MFKRQRVISSASPPLQGPTGGNPVLENFNGRAGLLCLGGHFFVAVGCLDPNLYYVGWCFVIFPQPGRNCRWCPWRGTMLARASVVEWPCPSKLTSTAVGTPLSSTATAQTTTAVRAPTHTAVVYFALRIFATAPLLASSRSPYLAGIAADFQPPACITDGKSAPAAIRS